MAGADRVQIDFANVQGLVVRGYPYPVSRHLLFRFETPAGAQGFLRSLRPRVTSARDLAGQPPPAALNVGISFNGLQATGAVTLEAMSCFPLDFQRLPTPQRLGDFGPAAHWWDGIPVEDLHCLVSLYADDHAALDTASQQVRSDAARTGTVELRVRPGGQPVEGALLANKRQLHFGYADGISTPDVGWADPVSPSQIDFRNYLLGYATAQFPSSPSSSPAPLPGEAEAAELARDGCYLAFRLMYQDVAAFNRFLADNAARLAPVLGQSPEEVTEWLAAKMLGRWPTGAPLALAPAHPNPALNRANDFDYRVDGRGEVTPFSAHIRVVNPRGQEVDVAQRPVPQLLRRGMPYGPPLEGVHDDGVDRGLIGLFLCNGLAAQFEKLMDWINRNDFSPAFTDLRAQDPLLGNRSAPRASTDFRIPRPGGDLVATGLTTFVQGRGTAYFLVPGLHALRCLAG